jgi:hypothetical protein
MSDGRFGLIEKTFIVRLICFTPPITTPQSPQQTLQSSYYVLVFFCGMEHDQHTSCRFRGKEERMLQWAPCFFALAASRAAGLGDKRDVAANWSAGRLFLLQLYALCPLPFSQPFPFSQRLRGRNRLRHHRISVADVQETLFFSLLKPAVLRQGACEA